RRVLFRSDRAPRSVAPDPESAVPEPVPVHEEERGAVAAQEPPEPAPARAIALSVLLPGAGHLAVGAPARGLAILLPWGVLLGLVYLVRARLAAVPRTGSLDDWVAVVTLFGSLVLLWA